MPLEAARRRRAILLLALLVVIWGLNWVMAKKSLEFVSPVWVTAFRLVPVCIVFFVMCIATKQLRIPVRADIPVIFSIGWLHMVGFSVLVSWGLQYLPAGKSIVLAYTTPLWVLPAAWLFLNESFTPRRILGLVIGMSGLVLILQPSAMDWGDRNVLIGHGFVLMGALLWAISIVYGRAHKWVTPLFALLPWQMLVGGLTQVVLAFALEGMPHFDWSLEAILLVGFGSLFGNGIAYWLMNIVSRDLPAAGVSMGLLGVPLIGLFCSSLFLGEVLGPELLIATVLIIAGIILGTLPKTSPPS
ncbi:MAG: DMT family transporter [Alcaligenaceae bacterium]|jgi:drug/metabolite transporter (DMT)-like permease